MGKSNFYIICMPTPRGGNIFQQHIQAINGMLVLLYTERGWIVEE